MFAIYFHIISPIAQKLHYGKCFFGLRGSRIDHFDEQNLDRAISSRAIAGA